MREVPGVQGVDSLRLRWIGHRLRAEIDLTVDCRLTVIEAHAIADQAHHRLLHDVARLDDATVHVNPCPHDDADHHQATAHHVSRSRPG